MKITSKLLALALLATVASPMFAEPPTGGRQHSTTTRDHTPRPHDRSLTARGTR